MYEKIKNITSLTLSRLGFRGDDRPEVAIVLGSGLGGVVDRIENRRVVPYASIEGFPVSTVQGHSGQFVAGEIGGRRVVAMQGRFHYYEGYSMDEVVLGVRVMCAMGVRVLIVTNAAGGLNPDFEVGDVMLIEDQINLLPNPLLGRNDDRLGVRFVDMNEAFSRPLRQEAIWVAEDLGERLRRGVYLGSSGPTYETPAEYNFFRTIGADACGMSTTSEVIAARHMSVEVLGFSIITNVGIAPDGVAAHVNSHEDVVVAAQRGGASLTKIIERCIQKL